MIPKVIHYCWFGGKIKPKLIRDCIKSWKEHLPHYKIIEWNEKNTDLSHPFVEEAYKFKKWAFVADYVRLKVLYEYGGIYLDTDMMLIKDIDVFMFNDCFFGAEDDKLISAGIIGSISKNIFIEKNLRYYDTLKFEINITTSITMPSILTKLFREENNYTDSFKLIIEFNNIKIYPLEYFYPLSYYKREDVNNYKNYITKNSYSVHLWNSSWIEFSEFYYIRNREYLKGFKIVKNKIVKGRKIEFKYIRKIASCLKQSIQ